jgi:uncharacterized protein YndB with AHSA1/START domain/DNA-binding transcriptional ArsR family regulator
VEAAILRAIGERNRMRIVELLNTAPRSVGEIALRLGLRQPQVTKHLQMLERAGLVAMHPLGQRRIYALRRERFAELRRWLDTIAATHASETVLREYANEINAEASASRKDQDFGRGRVFRFARELAAPASEVWAYWTRGRLVRRWWSPEHFEVVRARLVPRAGGQLEIVMQEGDGTRYTSRGRFIELRPPWHLRFELGPLGPDGAPLLSAVHDLTLASRRTRTRLSLTIRVTSAAPAAVPALAGMRLGWNQLLDKLQRIIQGATWADGKPRTLSARSRLNETRPRRRLSHEQG